jgi:hypothetical protein
MLEEYPIFTQVEYFSQKINIPLLQGGNATRSSGIDGIFPSAPRSVCFSARSCMPLKVK